ncbi:MAG: hypothetical protein KC478_14110 [Bacteriovoracaceae bacterium]|nr:hypothetical protein [Bacteriovoracaceae bacterium]
MLKVCTEYMKVRDGSRICFIGYESEKVFRLEEHDSLAIEVYLENNSKKEAISQLEQAYSFEGLAAEEYLDRLLEKLKSMGILV